MQEQYDEIDMLEKENASLTARLHKQEEFTKQSETDNQILNTVGLVERCSVGAGEAEGPA